MLDKQSGYSDLLTYSLSTVLWRPYVMENGSEWCDISCLLVQPEPLFLSGDKEMEGGLKGEMED